MKLREMKTEAYKKGTPPLDMREAGDYLNELSEGWQIQGERKINKTYEFKDFPEGLKFINRIAEIAEKENHHPDVLLTYGKVEIELSTHSIGGLSKNDFILADYFDEIYKNMH